MAHHLPVQLVVGNREDGPTRFEHSTFGDFLDGLEAGNQPDEPRYLKEFDLLKKLPQLRTDVQQQAFFPARSVSSSSVWIGPAGARTGLHYDLLDNVAVQILGTKRFYLAAPGTVEAASALSDKFDKWARLSTLSVEALSRMEMSQSQSYTVDLEPGDALFIPKRWWHAVENLTPSILLSGFHGPLPRVVGLYGMESLRTAAHRLKPRSGRLCTCCADVSDSPSLDAEESR